MVSLIKIAYRFALTIASGFAPALILLDTNLGLNRVWKKELEMQKEKDASGVALIKLA